VSIEATTFVVIDPFVSVESNIHHRIEEKNKKYEIYHHRIDTRRYREKETIELSSY
jgi:hypothetical protein